MLRCGPYGAGIADRPGRGNGTALSLDLLEESPHGIDLGPLQPRLPEVLRTASGNDRALPAGPARRPRAPGRLARARADRGLVLIGRRDLRSNNSWMHNLPHLVRGKDRCTMQVNPADAERLGLIEGGDGRGQLAGRAASSSRSR